MDKLIFAKKLYTGTEELSNCQVRISDGKIIALDSGFASADPFRGEVVDQLAPGFIDIHINGGEQYYFTGKVDEETLEDITASSRKHGTAWCLPTLITSPMENILKGITVTTQFMKRNPQSGMLGMHLEGPFLNPVKRGAHLLKYIQQPSEDLLNNLVTLGDGIIRMITIAPELFSPAQLDILLDSAITVSAGHSNADYQQAKAGFNRGIRTVTHLYNAMSAFGHRQPGLTGAALEDDRIFTPVIADGVHCDFGAVSIARKIKGEKFLLISDALFLGRKVKEFKWGAFDAYLENGKYVNSEGNLAGASVSLCDCVRNVVEVLKWPVKEAVEMVTIRPATAIGMESKVGMIKVSYPAVFTAFNDTLDNFRVIDMQ